VRLIPALAILCVPLLVSADVEIAHFKGSIPMVDASKYGLEVSRFGETEFDIGVTIDARSFAKCDLEYSLLQVIDESNEILMTTEYRYGENRFLFRLQKSYLSNSRVGIMCEVASDGISRDYYWFELKEIISSLTRSSITPAGV